MQADLHSGTDVAQHVLYDPTLITERSENFDDLVALAPAGKLLVMDTASDGEIGYRVYVDEEMPYELKQRISTTTKDILLRAPSGKLAACGLEYVADPKSFDGTLDLPAGNYLVDAHELDYDWDRDIAPVLHKELGGDYKREIYAGTTGGIFLVVGVLAAVFGLVSWTPIALIAGVGAVLVGIATLMYGIPRGDYHQRKDAIARRYPGLVLVLRKLPDDADMSAYQGKTLRFAD